MAQRKKTTPSEKSLKNLKPIRDPERARELQKRGTEVRRAKAEARKTMKYTLDILLSKSLRKGALVLPDDITNMAEAEGMNVDVQTAINIAVIQRAMMGDVQAIQFIRDTIGEKPSDKVELDQSLTIESWAKSHKVKL